MLVRAVDLFVSLVSHVDTFLSLFKCYCLFCQEKFNCCLFVLPERLAMLCLFLKLFMVVVESAPPCFDQKHQAPSVIIHCWAALAPLFPPAEAGIVWTGNLSFWEHWSPWERVCAQRAWVCVCDAVSAYVEVWNGLPACRPFQVPPAQPHNALLFPAHGPVG